MNNEEFEKMVTVLLFVLGLLLLGAVLATQARAADQWYAVTIRCQQSTDICTKRETAHVSEDRCNQAIERRAERIGKTTDVVVSFCMTEGETL